MWGLFSRDNFILVEDTLLQLSRLETNENAHAARLQYFFAVKTGAKILKKYRNRIKKNDEADQLGRFLEVWASRWDNIYKYSDEAMKERRCEILREPTRNPSQEEIHELKTERSSKE